MGWLRILQINLRRSGSALNLARQTAAELLADVILVSEQPRGPPDSHTWTSSVHGRAAIAIPTGSDAVVHDSGRARGLAWVRFPGLVLCSVYTSKNSTASEFRDFLGDLEEAVRAVPPGYGVVIGGDFNAKSPSWGSPITDNRGLAWESFLSSLGLLVCNVGSSPTFTDRGAGSHIDVTLACPAVGVEG